MRAMRQPFFIVGTGRCGSTFLCEILQAHPRVSLTNEAKVVDFLDFACRYSGLPAPQAATFSLHTDIALHGIVRPRFTERLSAIVRRHAKEILEEFYLGEYPDRDVTHWGDKLPNANAAHAVREIFPNTKYVILIRDPRDAYCSVRAFAARPEIRDLSPFLSFESADSFANYWQYTYHGAITWLPDHIVLRYRDLVRDPIAASARVLDFLGLPRVPEVDLVARGSRTYEGHGTSASPEVSIERWRQQLDPRDVRAIEAVCGELMQRYGYELAGV